MTRLSNINDLEEAKTEADHDNLVEYDDPSNPTRIGTDIVILNETTDDDQGKDIIENNPTMNNDDDNKNDTPPEETATTNGRKQIKMKVAADAPWIDRIWEVITTFWSLGLVAFGGPQAHVAILRDHLVERRDWIKEGEFMELFAIAQGLPGPSSTQLVVACAISRAGALGGLVALVLWNFPGMVLLTAFGIVIEAFIDPNDPPWYLVGLPPASIALVFTAFYKFALLLDKLGTILALGTCLAAILINNDPNISPQSSQFVFPSALAISGIITYIDSKRANPFGIYPSPAPSVEADNDEIIKRIGIPIRVGVCVFASWLIILIATILLVQVADITNVYLDMFETMYRVGSIIFGGGQVVLPLLQDEVVPKWMTSDQFLLGLGFAQSMPGPLFNFSAYLGAVYQGVPGALVAFVGIFGPGIILIFAAVPFWARLRHNTTFKSVLRGVNASAIGLVGAACVTLWESAIRTAADAMIFSISLTLSAVFTWDAPYCVIMGGIVGAILHSDALNLGQRPYCVKAGYQEVE